MIVFISDLHFVDETAGKHNAPVDAFHILLDDLNASVKRRQEEGFEVNEIKLVFLGDIFDILRTEQWFTVDERERPWGSDPQKTEQLANKIFDDIISKNKETFKLLGKSLVDAIGFPVEPERIYVPGNHDRLCNLYPSLRRKVRRNLGMNAGSAPFECAFQDAAHGVFARHGHEFDKFNYEGGPNHRYDDYMMIPIGDPITTELVAGLPWMVMQHPDVQKFSPKERKDLRSNLEDIENVRPFSATLEWLLHQVKNNKKAKVAIEESVDRLVERFEKLAFVKKWYDHHDQWTDWLDEADKIQAVLYLLKKFRVFRSEKWLPLLDKAKQLFAEDELLEGAVKEFHHLNEQIQYIVYGHSHDPLQAAVRLTPGEPAKPHVYLNSGTWRSRFHKCEEGHGFIGWKNLTYLIFWKPEEKGLVFPSFETWTGSLKTFKRK
jgi:UDP-2,3-diacylglucosamine pyrophosphatase LpxH